MALTINVPDTLRKSVEAASLGRNTVLYTVKGQPCYMYVLTHADMAAANTALGITRHPAFIVNGVDKSELFIGQHIGVSRNGEMLSLPGVDPINTINFDAAVSLARANGTGWHVMSNAEWAAVALSCYYNGFQPRGNTNYGKSSDLTTEAGVRGDGIAAGTASGNARTQTGSGPASWRHNNTPFGIADLCGNVWEWSPGMRVNSGEINIIANNNAALNATDMAAASAAWRAIDGATGALVAPGTAGTVKYAAAVSGTADSTLYRNSGGTFEGMVNSTGANPVGAAALTLLKSLCAYPIAASGLGGDVFHLSVAIEALPLRGGAWTDPAGAGVFILYCSNGRTTAGGSIGARPAFVL